jgi:hypothetical protein
MAEIHLHIGLNKTGTSSLQDFFSMNADTLRAEGWCYPRAGRDTTAHHPLSKRLKPGPLANDAATREMVAALRTELAGCERAVLSSEDFHTHVPRGIERIRDALEGHEVRVVLYVREHVAYLASWYQQNVQATHLSCAFDSFCYFTRKPLFKVADAWGEVFGRDRVTVRLYDRAALHGGDIVQDFAQVIGLGGDLARFVRKPYESNPSVTGNLLFIKRVVNNFFPKAEAAGFVDEVTALSKLKKEFRGAMFVDRATVNYVTGMYEGDRAQLAARHGVVIEPREHEYVGSRAPDMDLLADDWALVMGEARRRGFAIARATDLFTLHGSPALLATTP